MSRKALHWTMKYRNIIRLLHHAELPSPTIEAVIAQTRHLLDNRNFKHPPLLTRMGIYPTDKIPDIKTKLGIEQIVRQRTPRQKQLLDRMYQAQKTSAQTNWIFRIGAGTRDLADWYPFFVTLTLDPSIVPDYDNFWKKPKQGRSNWEKYLRRVSKVVTGTLGEEPFWKQKPLGRMSDYVQYVGVIEHGKSRHHHHVHALMFLREIPESWKRCPNAGIAIPENRTFRDCRAFETLWPYSRPGLSPHRYFRFTNDKWSKLGHVTPVDLETREAIKIRPPEAAGAYLGKYMNKDEKAWQHRTKATRNFGKKRLSALLDKMSMEELAYLAMRPHNLNTCLSLTKIHTVPLGLLRSEAKTHLFSRQLGSRQLDTTNCLQSSSTGFQKMLSDVQRGIRPDRMTSTQFYGWVGKHLGADSAYCDHQLELVHAKVSEVFPRHFYKENKNLAGNVYDRRTTQSLSSRGGNTSYPYVRRSAPGTGY